MPTATTSRTISALSFARPGTTRLGKARSKSIPALLSLVLSFAASATALADDTAAAEKFFKKQNNAVAALLKKKPSAARTKKLEEKLNKLLDYDALAQSALAKEWNKRASNEREEFTSLLKKLVQQNYSKNLESTASYKIKYLGSKSQKGGVLIRTEASSKTDKRAPAIAIDYLLSKSSGNWRVIDIITDEVSLVANYKAQFAKIIKKGGWKSLIQKDESKTQKVVARTSFAVIESWQPAAANSF